MQVSEPLRVGGVVIEEIDHGSLSDDAIRRYNLFVNELGAESFPGESPEPFELTASHLRQAADFMRRRTFWAYDEAGNVVASGSANWTIAKDNQHILRPLIHVRADFRERGIAKTLLRLITEVAEAEGRTLLTAGTTDRVPAGQAFACRVGAENALEEHTNRLILADVDHKLVDLWIAEGPGRAPGYSLIAIDGPYPDELVDAAMRVGEVMNTAPRGNLDREDEEWTAEEARAVERNLAAHGTERWSLFARHDGTGELVGFTEVAWNAKAPETVWQWGTGVMPAHRGHALGKWLKATMLRRILDERPSKDVRTGNADSNAAMLGINNALGFRPFTAHIAWQVTIERVRAYLDGSSV